MQMLNRDISFMSDFVSQFGFSPSIFWSLAIFFSIWTFFWKGLALWKAARLSHKKWFVVLLIVNTTGILEIVYIYFFARKSEAKKIDNID